MKKRVIFLSSGIEPSGIEWDSNLENEVNTETTRHGEILDPCDSTYVPRPSCT